MAINQLYAAHDSPLLSGRLWHGLWNWPATGGCASTGPKGGTDAFTVENMLMFYDEVRDRLRPTGF